MFPVGYLSTYCILGDRDRGSPKYRMLQTKSSGSHFSRWPPGAAQFCVFPSGQGRGRRPAERMLRAVRRRAPELLVVALHRGRSHSGSQGVLGTENQEARGVVVVRDRSPHGGLHVKPAALRARELRPAWAPLRPRTGPLAVALRARAPLCGGRFKRLVRRGRARAAVGSSWSRRWGGAAASADDRLPLTPINPVSPGRCCLTFSCRWGTMVTKAGLRAFCGVQGLPGETSMGPQLGSPEISKVCPWNLSVASAKSLVHQKLSPRTTCAVPQAEGLKQTGNSRAEAGTGLWRVGDSFPGEVVMFWVTGSG